MSILTLLDLFCGAGGAAAGYSKAGFTIIGVDIRPQPNYPFEFIQADALDFLSSYERHFNLIHASPPCQGYSSYVTSQDSKWVRSRGKNEPQLIAPLRRLLGSKPYVIENVTSAREHMNDPVMLCGIMFGLVVRRHRLFETNWNFKPPVHPKCLGVSKQYALENNIDYRDLRISGKGRSVGTSDRWRSFMGIDWYASQREIVEMIPPVYTEYVGKQYVNTQKGGRRW